MLILCLNRGSSSLRYAAYRLAGIDALPVVQINGTVRYDVHSGGRAEGRQGELSADRLVERLRADGLAEPAVIVHRLVRGPNAHDAPVWLDSEYIDRLRGIADLAPVHLPPALALIDACRQHFGRAKQAACFDTAFHGRLPELATRLPFPAAILGDMQRTGFHGLSYEYVMHALNPSGRTVIAHLGGGASMAAVKDGIPIDTSMGFSPIGGMMMGTRSGDLDPGLLIYWLRRRGFSADTLESLVAEQAGLLGVSGRSADMRTLLAACEADAEARLAVELFCYLAGKQLGAMTWALGGLDTLVFTGGIGEYAAPVRARICSNAGFLGVDIDASRNAKNDPVISTDESPCSVRIIPTDEQWVMAGHARALLAGSAAGRVKRPEASSWTN